MEICIGQKSRRSIISYQLFPLQIPFIYLFEKLNKEKLFYLQNLKQET